MVYAAGVVAGIALVTFPAASTVFTDPVAFMGVWSFAVARRGPSPASLHRSGLS